MINRVHHSILIKLPLDDDIPPHELDLDEMSFLFHYWADVAVNEK